MYLFAALRFTEDGNISDRVYWYLSEFTVQEGDYVYAPVGSHNRLQRARVERTISADEEHAPYDVRLIKKIAAKWGARKIEIGGAVYFELGGVMYDPKRYTAFKRVWISETVPRELEALRDYGVCEIVVIPEVGAGDALRKVIAAKGCVLLCGEGAEDLARDVIRFLRGEREVLSAMLFENELRMLVEKLL